MTTFTCPTCAQQLNTKTHYWHARTCAKRPSDDQLRQDRKDGLTYTALSKKYGVSGHTATKWCKELGIDGKVKPGKSVDRLVVYPEYAPFYGPGRRCDTCAGRPYCDVLVFTIPLMLCEAPEEYQLAELERRGVDLVGLVGMLETSCEGK